MSLTDSKSLAQGGAEFRIHPSSGVEPRSANSTAGLQLLQAFFIGEPSVANPKIISQLQSALRTMKGLRAAVSSLGEAERGELEKKVGKARLEEIVSLSEESDTQLFWSGANQIALRLKQADQLQPAGALYSAIVQGGDAVPAEARKQAQLELDAMTGKGGTGRRMEFLTQQFVKQATDVKTIAPMILGSAVYSLTRATVLGRMAATVEGSWFTRGVGARLTSSLAGFAAEVPTFALSSRALISATDGGVSWDGASVGKDLLGASLTLGALKVFGHLGNQGFLKLHGIGEMEAAQLTRFQKFSQAAFGQGSMFAGMMFSHKLEEQVGLRPHVDGSTAVTDTLASMVSMGIGGHLGNKMLGARFASFQQELGIRTNLYSKALDSAPRGGKLGFPGKAAYAADGLGAIPQNFAMSVNEEGLGARLPTTHAMMMTGSGESQGRQRQQLAGSYVVIGNRGEPAVRGVNEAKKLGATPVVFYSEADANSLHANMDGVIALPLKGNTSNETYNNIPARMAALEKFMKDREVAPERLLAWEGWGFKSEDSELFALYEKLGIRPAGAASHIMAMMGNKISARAVAERAGVPTVPGSGKLQSYEEALEFARQTGFPVIIKGGDTGGGKGIRVALTEAELQNAYDSAKREALSTSGSDVVFMEKFIPSMRHLEVQVIGDGKGNFTVVGVRDCTMQRNKQKVLEEDVSTFLAPEVLDQAKVIGSKIMAQLKADDHRKIGYEGPGTIELIWDRSDDQLYFMEMNTRLQVEHTVTEMVSGRNLLREQLLIGSGRQLSFGEVEPRGHAIEARITSEDPYNKFTPSTGRILHMRLPETSKDGRSIVRVDSGVESGREIPSHYDSMIAKLIVWAPTRAEAVAGLQQALGEFEVLGIKTNIPFLRALSATPEFLEGKGYDTNFIEKKFLNSEAGRPVYPEQDEALIAAAVHTYLQNPGIHQKVELKAGDRDLKAEVYEIAPGRFLVQAGDSSVEVGLSKTSEQLFTLEVGGRKIRTLIHGEPGRRDVLIDGVSYEVNVGGEGALGAEYVVSSAPASVLKILKSVGDPVKAGEPIVVNEAMKMETTLTASMDGTVESIHVKPGQQIDKGKVLIKIKPSGEAKVGEKKEASAKALELPQSRLQLLAESETIDAPQAIAALEGYERFFDGYTAPLGLLKKVLHKLEPSAEAGPDYAQAVEVWASGLLKRYKAVEAVFQPAYQRQWGYFLKTGKVEDSRFESVLKSALQLYGVDSLEATPARDAAVKRLYQSHEQSEGKRELLGILLQWIPKHEMNSLRDVLAGVSRLFADQGQTPFLTQVEETVARLREKGSDREYLQKLEEEFAKIVGMNRNSREKAIRGLLARTEVILPFLLTKAAGASPRDAHWALKMAQQRLYRNFYNFGSQVESSNDRMVLTKMEPKSRQAGKPLLVMHRRSLTIAEFEKDLGRSLQQLHSGRKKLSNGADSVIEMILPSRPSDEEFRRIEEIASQKLTGQNIQRLTIVIPDAEGGDPDYRTYAANAAGVVREDALLRDIHPLHAQTIGLSRWTQNFNLERQDFGLFHNIHAYRATQKGLNPNDAKADRRHFVIGEHTGPLSYDRFDGELVRNQLVQDFRSIKGGKNGGFSKESRLIWQWLPFALRESGLVGKDFDPFAVGVLAASPAEIVEQFHIDETKLARAASVYDGKIFSVPEAEQLAKNTALVMKRLQESYVQDGEARKLPALADIFFRNPIELSDDEIKLLAFRLTPQFMGQQLEKTVLHFNRRTPSGAIESYIAEIKIPRGSRFEVNIKPVLEAPAHAVKTPLEHKRAQQQGRGKLYVYDRVALFNDVLKDFYPKGNLPEDAVQIRELVLDKSGKLNPVLREVGMNDIGKVAFHVSLKLPKGEDTQEFVTREFAVIADDYTFQAGSQGTKEGEIYRALSRYAEEKGIPKLYLAETSGARLGLAEEVTPFISRDDEKGVNYVRAEDLQKPAGKSKKPLSELLVVGEPYEVKVGIGEEERSETRLPVQAVIGEGEINSESLNASGKTGESESRARSVVPTFTIALGTVIGIGTYDTKLSERVIMVADSFLGLTGRKAINQTFGTHLKDELEVAGPEIMRENGVAYKVAPGERDAVKGFLQWLSYLPPKRGEAPVRIEGGDPVERDITPGLIGGDNPVIKGKGQPYDTRAFDAALYDRGSVFYVREGYGRAVNTGYARLGGRPVGLITMQLQPEQIPGGEPIFGGALDASASFKISKHLDNLNSEGLPVVFNASISGFMPRPEDHLKGVVPGGAKILDSLRVFAQPALIYIPPYGQLWGGAWVVVDKNINPNIVMVADQTAAMGILGSAGAISVPKNERAMEADLFRDPELVALRARRDRASGKEREAIELAYREAAESLRIQHYLPKWRAILDAQNTAERAYRVGSIQEIIRNTAQTRAVLSSLLDSKTREIQTKMAEQARLSLERNQVSGALTLMGIQHQWDAEGAVTLHSNGIEIRIPQGNLAEGLRNFFRQHSRGAMSSIIETSLADK